MKVDWIIFAARDYCSFVRRVTLTSSYEYRHDEYWNATFPDFSVANRYKREDDTHLVEFALSIKIWNDEKVKNRLEAILDYKWTRDNSNVPRNRLTIRDLWPCSNLIFDHQMFPRYFALVTALLLFAGRSVDAQVDAQDRTQTFFDDHKGADVINSDRAITDTVRRSPAPVQVSALPPLTGVSEAKFPKADAKEICKLRSQKQAFIEKEVRRNKRLEESIAGIKAAALDVPKMTKQAEKNWENIEPAESSSVWNAVLQIVLHSRR